jgi:hypothetical protein
MRIVVLAYLVCAYLAVAESEVHTRWPDAPGIDIWGFPLVGLLCAIPCLIVVHRIKRSIERIRRCSSCGYDLRASRERCPECGAPIQKSDEPSSDNEIK